MNSYRGLGSGATIEDILQIDRLREYTSIYELTHGGLIWDKLGPQPTGDNYIFELRVTFPDPCNNSSKAHFGAMALMNGVTSFKDIS